MSKKQPSKFICKQCGIPCDAFRGTWRHLLNGATGAIPKSMRHKAVPEKREDFEARMSEFRKQATAAIKDFEDKHVRTGNLSACFVLPES